MRGFDHDDAERAARDQAVAPWKIPCARHVAKRHFGNRGTAGLDDRGQEVLMLGRVDFVVTTGQHGNGAASDRGAMRRLVDATCETRHDDETRFPEIARQLAGKFQPGAGGIARADDGNHRPQQHIMRATHAEQRRRIVKGGEARRITGFAGREQADALPFARGNLGARVVLAEDAARASRTAPPRQIGQPLQGAASAAEMIDQGTKRARPDMVGTDQPQPVDALRVGQMSGAGRSSVHAVPREAAWINWRVWATRFTPVIPGSHLTRARNDGLPKAPMRLPDPGAVRKSGAASLRE